MVSRYAYIKEHLRSIGMTQAFLARKTGIRYNKLVGALNGYWNLKPHELELVCEELNIGEPRSGEGGSLRRSIFIDDGVVS